LTKEMDEPVK